MLDEIHTPKQRRMLAWSDGVIEGPVTSLDLLFRKENVGGGCIGPGGSVVKHLAAEAWDLGSVHTKFSLLNYSSRG